MGLIQRLFKGTIEKQVQKAISSAYAVQSYVMLAGYPVFNLGDAIRNINDGYCGSDDFYSIIKRICRTMAMIPLKVYEVIDDGELKNYKTSSSQKNYNTKTLLKNQFLKNKALEEVGSDNELQLLIDNPNPTYSKTEFYEGYGTFLLTTGNTYINMPSIEFGVNAGKPAELWLMPSQFTSLQVSDTWPRRVVGYRLIMGEIINIPVEDVIHVRYFNPQYTYVGNELIGLSPLRAGNKVLTRQESETDYSVNAFQNMGISGIVSNESLTQGEIEEGAFGKMKTDFYGEATGVVNARKLLVTAGKWNYTEIGLSPVDMELLEAMKLTFKKACNLFGVSDRLFNNDATGSEISTDVVYKDLYTNAALPLAYAIRDAFNNQLTPKYNTNGKKYFIDVDITGIVELQDDFKDLSTVFSTLPIMNPKVIAAAMGWDSDDVEDKWFIKQGYVTVEDAIAGMSADPLPVDTTNGN